MASCSRYRLEVGLHELVWMVLVVSTVTSHWSWRTQLQGFSRPTNLWICSVHQQNSSWRGTWASDMRSCGRFSQSALILNDKWDKNGPYSVAHYTANILLLKMTVFIHSKCPLVGLTSTLVGLNLHCCQSRIWMKVNHKFTGYPCSDMKLSLTSWWTNYN